LFLSRQEAGFTDLKGAHGLPDAKKRNFVAFGRSALLGIWSAAGLKELLQVRESLVGLPGPIRSDLVAFLAKLQDYRRHYERLKKTNPGLLSELFRREEDGYYWFEAYWRKSEPQLRKNAQGGIGSSELSKALDKELREVSDVARTDPAGCYVDHYGPSIGFPSEALERENTEICATKYMISFWRRRDLEGISALASYIVDQTLAARRAPG
jgi:hypothetical protein